MSNSSPSVVAMQQEVSAALSKLETIFVPGMQVGFFAIHPTLDTAHVLISNASYDEIREAIDLIETQNAPAAEPKENPSPPLGACEGDERREDD